MESVELCRMDIEIAGNEELEFLIAPLRRAGNSREEIGNPFFNVMKCEDLLFSILKANNSSELLKDKTDLCVMILNTLLTLSRQKEWNIIISLLKIVLESNLKENNVLIKDLWSKQELCRIPAEVVVLLLNYKPALVETQLRNLYSMARRNENIWQSDCFLCWAIWCSKSTELFNSVSSIINQFLIYLKANSVILKIVRIFIMNVMAECEANQRNILSLYPKEYQSLAALLMIEPDFNPYVKTAIKKINIIKNADSKALLILLSHFPVWMKVIYK